MGIRTRLNEKSTIVLLVVSGFAVFSLYFLISGLKGRSPANLGTNFGQYYTADDGKTWIADERDLVVPFERAGKTYVRLIYYSFDGKTPATGFLQKYTPALIKQATTDDEANHRRWVISSAPEDGTLVKKIASEGEWVLKSSPQGTEIISRPENGGNKAREIFPNWVIKPGS